MSISLNIHAFNNKDSVSVSEDGFADLAKGVDAVVKYLSRASLCVWCHEEPSLTHIRGMLVALDCPQDYLAERHPLDHEHYHTVAQY